MKGWNPFGKVDMEIGSFLKASPFNKKYGQKDKDEEIDKSDKENNTNK
jgi:hypothetical protein